MKKLQKNKYKGQKYKERKNKEDSRREIRTKRVNIPKSSQCSPHNKSTPCNRHKFSALPQQHSIAFIIKPKTRRTSQKSVTHKICAARNRHKFGALWPQKGLYKPPNFSQLHTSSHTLPTSCETLLVGVFGSFWPENHSPITTIQPPFNHHFHHQNLPGF